MLLLNFIHIWVILSSSSKWTKSLHFENLDWPDEIYHIPNNAAQE